MKLTQVPSLGNDQETAARLIAFYQEARDAAKAPFNFGCYAICVKMQLKHGQFKPWLQAYCPQVAYRTVADHMQFAREVLAHLGITERKIASKVQTLHISHYGELLSLPESNLNEAAKEIRSKLLDCINNKTKKQVLLSFRQIDEEAAEAGVVKPKRGRAKGEGGASREQRAAAKDREERARIGAIEAKSESFTDWLTEVADHQGLGQIDDTIRAKLCEAMEHAVTYCWQLKRGNQ